jgi:hypothetical protein
LSAAPSGTLPVGAGQLDSLLDVFRRAPDPREDNTRYRIGPVLTLIALARLAKLPARDGQRITADPLPGQRGLARTVVEKGGDYRFQIKGNQPRLLKQAQGLDALQDTPFLPTAQAVTGACQPGGCTPSPSNR